MERSSRTLGMSLVSLGACACACGLSAACAAEPGPLAVPAHAEAPVVAPPPDLEISPEPSSRTLASRTSPTRYETRRIEDRAPASARWSGRPINLDVKDADVQEVFRLLADVGHVNIVVAGEVSGRVTLRLVHVPWDQAFDVVVRARSLVVERDGNVFLVRAP